MPKKIEDSDSDSSNTLEKPKKEKVDKRKTGGLTNRTPAQQASFEKMKEVAFERAKILRQNKIDEGKILLAKQALAKEEKQPKPKATIKKSKTTLVFQDDSDSDDDTPTIVIKKKSKKKKQVVVESSSEEEEDEPPTPQAPQARQAAYTPSYTFV